MTQLLQQAFESVSALTDERQDEIARVMLQLASYTSEPIELTAEEEADLDASLAEAERGEFATDEEIAAVWARFRR